MNKNRQLIAYALPFVAIGCLAIVYITAAADDSAATDPPAINISRAKSWITIDQLPTRKLYLRTASVGALAAYPADMNPATRKPFLRMVIVGHEFRLDVSTIEEAQRVADLITGQTK